MADVINTESSLLQISLSFADYLCITYILSFRYITYRIIVLYCCDVLSPCLYQSPSQTKTNYVRLQYLPPSSPTNAMPGHLRHGAISGHRQPRLLTGTKLIVQITITTTATDILMGFTSEVDEKKDSGFLVTLILTRLFIRQQLRQQQWGASRVEYRFRYRTTELNTVWLGF